MKRIQEFREVHRETAGVFRADHRVAPAFFLSFFAFSAFFCG
jgi:hypothetical protein